MGNVRVSFGRNSAGALEIVDANDYYPFGMNHLKTGNAFFGQGSFKNYKFLGNELQETGLYDMNARFYMADLGRFGQHDPLSASTLDPHGYAYNNPMLFADPSGLEGDPVNGGGGSGGPVTPASFGDIPGGYNGAPTLIAGAGINDVAAEQNIQGVVLNSKGKSSNSAAAMPTNCIACSVGSGVTSGIELSKPQPTPLPLNWDCGHCHDHGVVMMDSMWDVVGIVIANNVSPEDQDSFLALSALAIILSKGTATDEVLKAEAGILKAEAEIVSAEVNLTKAGRTGKQARLRELSTDPKLGKADKGWLKSDINQVSKGKRTTVRNPPGKDLAHERGREAAKGYSYKYSHLQDRVLHRKQHKYDNGGRRNKERPVQ